LNVTSMQEAIGSQVNQTITSADADAEGRLFVGSFTFFKNAATILNTLASALSAAANIIQPDRATMKKQQIASRARTLQMIAEQALRTQPHEGAPDHAEAINKEFNDFWHELERRGELPLHVAGLHAGPTAALLQSGNLDLSDTWSNRSCRQIEDIHTYSSTPSLISIQTQGEDPQRTSALSSECGAAANEVLQ